MIVFITAIHDYSAIMPWLKKLRQVPKFKVGDKSGLLGIRFFLAKATQYWSKEIFVIDSVLKTNHWTYKIKNLSGEKITARFYEKELFFRKL